MTLNRDQMAAMSRLLDEPLALDETGRRKWLQNLPSEHLELAESLRAALLLEPAHYDSLVTLPKIIIGQDAQGAAGGLKEGDRFGPYELIRPLGSGGMAEVWLARRSDGAIKRDVALKLPLVTRLRRDLEPRFAREREILAGLSHPNIARLFDAGFADDGQPYLALEYVVGEMLTTYCDQQRLTIRERLGLLRQVLGAVQYAHTHLVIHRDLKPSNVLVTVEGQVQLLDFGIAKLLSEGEAKETELTLLAGRSMTPDYAAPEQITGAPITTAADVYALGVILYEILTGGRPYRLKRDTRAALEEAILQADPIPPSRAALTETASMARATTAKRLSRALKGDLDAITIKALKKSSRDRYQTVTALDEDIARFLAGDVVQAQPDSIVYRANKFARRHWVAIAVVSALMLTLAGGVAATSYEAMVAQRQSVRAEREARTAHETTRFMVDLFKISDPGEARGNTVTAREMLDKGAARVDQELAAQPAIRATLMDTLGTVYVGLGLYPQARPLLDRAVEERRRLDGDDPLALPNSLEHRGDVEYRQAEFASAEKDYLEAIRLESQRPAERDSQIALANALHGLGFLLNSEGRYTDAERDLRDALARQRALYGDVHPDIGRTLKDLARALADAGDLKQAIPIMESAVAMQRRLRGSQPHPDLAEAINDLALLQNQSGNFAAAAAGYDEALALKRRLYGERHPEIASGLENLAGALQDKGDLAGAEASYRLALSMNRELLGNDHPDVALTLHNLASLQYDRGETAEALATEGESLAIYRKVYPEGHRRLAFTLNTLGFWLALAGRYTDAERDVHEALDMRRRLLGDKHPEVASSLVTLAHLDVAEKKYSDALAAAQSAAQIYTAAISGTHWRTAFAESVEGAALCGLGRYGEAEPLLVGSNSILSKAADAPQVVRQLNGRYMDLLRRRSRGLQQSGECDGRGGCRASKASARRSSTG